MCGIFGYLRLDGQSISLKARQQLLINFAKTQHRGPEQSIFQTISQISVLGFHRLRINDVHHGTQPFHNEEETVFCICNGEIYNHEDLTLKYDLYTKSNSDCEVIYALYMKYGKDKFQSYIGTLDGVYAFVIIDLRYEYPELIMSRDPFGIRSMYYVTNDTEFYFASEVKSLPHLQMKYIKHFPAGHMYTIRDNIHNVIKYPGIIQPSTYMTSWCTPIDIKHHNDNTFIQYKIRRMFENAVKKRMMSSRPIGCLLSGGLDSSVVAALVAKQMAPKRLHTFSIGMEGATDLKYARMVADHINSIHHEVVVTEQEMLDVIPEVIYHIESWDETTVLASVPMYLLSKYIKENTDIIVVYTGEGADELFGSYMYFHNAPTLDDFQNETCRLLEELQYYDVLRCEKCIAAHGLEARVPFLDFEFVDAVASLHPIYKDPKYNKKDGRTVGKYLMRQMFDDGLLPSEVLWRVKEAFSNGCSSLEKDWHMTVNNYCKDMTFQKDVLESGGTEPHSKKGAYFRQEFIKSFGMNCVDLIPGYWVPKWSNGSKDSSARTLGVYKNLIQQEQPNKELP
jgi:asparagine synthase (glutamine-hydrolysing)